MADVDPEYIVGTQKEYLRLELEATAPGFTFVSSDWTAKVALCSLNDDFDADTATWYDATLDTVDAHHYVLVMIGTEAATGLSPAAGRYKVFVRPVKKVGDAEKPLIEALGTANFVHG